MLGILLVLALQWGLFWRISHGAQLFFLLNPIPLWGRQKNDRPFGVRGLSRKKTAHLHLSQTRFY